MPGDINAYALGLELQLQTDKASAALKQFKEQLVGVEKSLTIAPNVFPTKEAQQATQATAAYGSEAESANKILLQFYRTFQDYRNVVDEINEGSGLMTKSVEKQMKQFFKLKLETEKLNQDLKKLDLEKTFGPNKAKHIKHAMSSYEGLGVAVNDLTEGTQKQAKVLDSALGILKATGDSGVVFAEILRDIAVGAGAAAITFKVASHSLASLMQMQDSYVVTTMRAAGTTEELIAATNELGMSLGATTEEGVATLKALAAAGFRANESLEHMAKTNFMFSQATGVGTKQTADFQRAIFTTTKDANLTTKAVSEMAAAIRHSGMSAEEAAGLMGNLTKAMRPLRFLFGEKQALSATKAITQFTAVVRRAGGDAEVAAQELTALAQSPEKMITSFAMVGADIDKLDFAEYFEKATETIADLGKEASGLGEALTSQAIIDATGISATMADNYKRVWEEAGHSTKKFRELMATQVQGADIQEDFNQTLQTFTKSIKQAIQPILALGTIVLDTITPALQAAMKIITPVVSLISGFVAGLSKIPVVGSLVKAAIGTMLLIPIANLTTKFLGLGGAVEKTLGLISQSKSAFAALGGVWQTQAAKGNLLSMETMRLAKLNMSDIPRLRKSTEAFVHEGRAITLNVAKLRELRGLKISTAAATKNLTGITRLASEGYTQFTKASEAAGGGIMGMGSGVMSLVGNLAKAHPAITAIVGAVTAAFVIVPQLMEWFDKGSASIKLLTGALMVLMAPLTLAYVQLRALWEVLKGVWEGVTEVLDEAFKPLSESLKSLFGDAEGNISIMKIFETAMHKIGLAAKVAVKAFTPFVWVAKTVASLFGKVVDVIKGVWDAVKDNAAIKFIIKAVEMIDQFLNQFEKADEAVEEGFNKDNRSFEQKMWGVEAKDLNEAQRSVTDYGRAMRQAASPAVGDAVSKVYEKIEVPAEPVVKQTTRVAASRDPVAKVMDDGFTKIYQPLMAMLAAMDKDKQLEVLEAIHKIAEDTLPKIAEGSQSSLGPTAANNWIA